MNSTTTRRQFLALSASALTTAGIASRATADEDGRGGRNRNVLRIINMQGITPDEHAIGAVSLLLDYTYLVFDALQRPLSGPVREGFAAVRLDGCLLKRSRVAGDEQLPMRTIRMNQLLPYTVYEVQNSTLTPWVRQQNPTSPLVLSGAVLRHNIITFAETAYEWIGTGLNPYFTQSSFEELKDYLESL
jgi:hypothetical protein